MLRLDDAIVMPKGVRLDGRVVVDDVRSARYPANDTALFVLRRAGCPLGAVGEELARRHRLDPARARDDVLRFAQILNASLLANVVRRAPRRRRLVEWILLTARLAPAGTLPSPAWRRLPIDTTTAARAAATTARALAGRASALAAVATVLALQPLPVAPRQVVAVALALGVGVGLGVVAHEVGHAVVLLGTRTALVLAGPRTYLLHEPVPPRRRRAVAVAGPLFASVLGAGVVAVGWAARAPELALAGCGPVGHAVGLTVATRDGRAACGF